MRIALTTGGVIEGLDDASVQASTSTRPMGLEQQARM